MAQRVQNLGRHFSSANLKKPVKVTLTGSTGQIGYVICFMIGQGRLLGPNQPIDLCLFDIPAMEKSLRGLVMEIKDCAFPLLNSITTATNYEAAFKNCNIALLVGALPRKVGMERKDLLKLNAKIFKEQGEFLNKFADKNVKVVVVGNPANTNAFITSTFAPNIPAENFTSLTRLDQNRAISQVADKMNVPVKVVKNAIIWGNHSSTQYADIQHGYLEGLKKKNLKDAINDNQWIQKEFIETVANRGAAILKARKASSAASAANAICDHIHDWIIGTKQGEYVSMGVMSDGSYGIPKGINFSFPVTCANGKWKIVQGLELTQFDTNKFNITLKELQQEKEDAMSGFTTKN